MSCHSFLQQLALVLLFVLLFVAQFDGISWDKGCQDRDSSWIRNGPGLNQRPPVRPLFHVNEISQIQFSKQKGETGVWKFGQRGSYQICNAIDGQMRGKGHPAPLFGGIRPHPQPLKAALIHQQLFCLLLTFSLNFRQLPFFAQVFCLGICQWGCERSICNQMNHWKAEVCSSEYWWGKNGC